MPQSAPFQLRPARKPGFSLSESLSRDCLMFWGLAIFLLAVMLRLSFDYGITWDEWIVSNGGIAALRYLLSSGKDTESLTFLGIAMYYGQIFYSIVGFVYGTLFDSFHEFVQRGLRADKDLIPFFNTSHFINAFFGWTAMLYTARIVKDISSWKWACISLLLIALSPRFFGHSMNNSKDIPFAAAYIFSLFYMIRYMRELPNPKIKTTLLLIAGIAAALGVRIGALLLLCYFVLFLAAACFFKAKQAGSGWKWKKIIITSIAVIVLSYFGGLIFWPYGQHAPFSNPMTALRVMSHYSAWNGNVLFEGEQIKALELPWYYLPKWLLISTPVSVIMGLLFLMMLGKSIAKRYDPAALFVVLFAFLFPLLYIILKKANVYDGMRHVLFIYPPLTVLAVLGWHRLCEIARENRRTKIALFFLAVCLIDPLVWMIRNHPNQYVYFNPLVGGVNGVSGKYETDYFGNCLREASEWLENYHEQNYPYQPLLVRADGQIMSTYPYLKDKFSQYYKPYGFQVDFLQTDPFHHINYGPYTREPKMWTYAILMSRGWNPEQIAKEWPPAESIYQVLADDTTLCAVIENK